MSRILVVDDEQHLAEGLRFNLVAEHHEVEVVDTGEAALAQLFADPVRFDLVILDVMLPGTTGFGVVAELRRAGQFVPVLMLTARGRPEDVLQGFQSGADDYLPKPFELPILMARVRGLLRRREWFRLGLVRQHATEWGIDPKRVGVLGFSAGGHLAAALSTRFDQRPYDPIDAADKLSCRPDFAVVVYPGYLALEDKGFAFTSDIPVTKETPPTFLVQAEDDPVHVENAVEYFLALKGAGVPAELHVYAEGGHGYGLRRTRLPVTGWPDLVDVWMKSIGVTPAGR